MNDIVKGLLDLTIKQLRERLLTTDNINNSQKTLIIAMGQSLSSKVDNSEYKEYLYEESKKLLKELFEIEERQTKGEWNMQKSFNIPESYIIPETRLEKIDLYTKALHSIKSRRAEIEIVLANSVIANNDGNVTIAALETLDMLDRAFDRIDDAKERIR